MERYVSFDWAMKRLLRDKANYVVLEGLLSTLLEKQIKIQQLLESESNQDDENDKQNRVDVLAEDETGALYIIEVQNNTETAYFQRMLFGTSKLITQYMRRGDAYEKVRKIYSVNIVYFNLGGGTDYVYHGKTEFRGLHNGELLDLSPFQMDEFKADAVSDLYPEYFILKVDGFNEVAKTPLQEWIAFLKDGSLRDNTTTPGLERAREVMRYDTMTDADKRSYDRKLMDRLIIADNVRTARREGRAEGRAEGRLEGIAEGRLEGIAEGRAEGIAEGRAEGRAEGIAEGRAEGIAEGARQKAIETARKLLSRGFDASEVAELTGLAIQDIQPL